jgi:hypothetical protein
MKYGKLIMAILMLIWQKLFFYSTAYTEQLLRHHYIHLRMDQQPYMSCLCGNAPTELNCFDNLKLKTLL